MSNYGGGYYSDEAPRRRSHRSRRPVYEEKIVESRQGRGQPPVQTALVRRPRSDSSSSVEEIEREFDPESGAYIQRQRTTRDRYGDRYQDARSDADYSRKSAGTRKSGGRRRRDSYDSYNSYDSESESDRSRPALKRRQSVGEKALEAIGLGGAAAAISDKIRGRSKSRQRGRADSRDDSRDSTYSSYNDRRTQSARGRSSSRGPDKRKRIEDAAKAALAAAAVEAWRSRKNVGGEAGKRILTAAISAAGIDAVVQQEDRHGNRNALASAIGGLATNRLVNGRSRSRSRPGQKGSSNAGTAASVAALAALAGKAIKDRNDRSKSRSRPRGGGNDDYYGSDADEEDTRAERRRKSLSEHFHKPTDRILEKMGFPDSENHKDCYYVDKYGRRHYSDDEDDGGRNAPRPRGGGGESDSSSGCSTDSYDSDEERQHIKKIRNKRLITAGLAAVATIHAAHSVHSSMEAREKRHERVLQGKMTPEEARRLKSRAALQDVAAVGIAALGIKGAFSEWKEVKEQRGSMANRNVRLEEMREHREQKKQRGEWDEELWRRKRQQRAQSQGRGAAGAIGAATGAAAGDDDNDGDNQSRRSNNRRAITNGRDGDKGDERDSRRRRGRSSRQPEYSDEEDDEDERYEYEYRTRKSYRASLPPDFRRGSSYYGRPEKYDPAVEDRRDGRIADGPLYADGNPYTTTQTRSNLGLRQQLPPPPVGYSAAPRY